MTPDDPPDTLATALAGDAARASQDSRIAATVKREAARLRSFIRRRVADPGDADDILQDVLYELVAAYRMSETIEQWGAWLFRVARNRIIDRARKQRELPLPEERDDDEALWLENIVPAVDAGPDAAYARRVLRQELHAALAELPAEQRDVFIAHELNGTPFKMLAEQTGVGVNTLLARKRYAVLHLRKRLQPLYENFDQPD
jgi:RNA polymerase sigma factor (sigma-70 family)